MSETEMEEQIREALNEIRPALQADGGRYRLPRDGGWLR